MVGSLRFLVPADIVGGTVAKMQGSTIVTVNDLLEFDDEITKFLFYHFEKKVIDLEDT